MPVRTYVCVHAQSSHGHNGARVCACTFLCICDPHFVFACAMSLRTWSARSCWKSVARPSSCDLLLKGGAYSHRGTVQQTCRPACALTRSSNLSPQHMQRIPCFANPHLAVLLFCPHLWLYLPLALSTRHQATKVFAVRVLKSGRLQGLACPLSMPAWVGAGLHRWGCLLVQHPNPAPDLIWMLGALCGFTKPVRASP